MKKNDCYTIRKFDTPIDFSTEIKADNIEIIYCNTFEIGQGGPVVGNISINGNFIPQHYFGGPVLLDKKNVYIPIYMKKMFFWRFKLARINLGSFKIDTIRKWESVIFLDKIENGIVFFYKEVSKTHSNYYKLSDFNTK
ncbi:MAG: hypothetical protein LBE79_01550 [Tannerella sp.]|jgi:hypothetical protein|nr:hypothetical protein [Tannerella sp.]